jgi:hypothetical protein
LLWRNFVIIWKMFQKTQMTQTSFLHYILIKNHCLFEIINNSFWKRKHLVRAK